ncbi:MAG: histidine phosphatase family protein [Rhodobacteraceae bacterium]|nr:histidine phosphatase family protein [Paracoccaceae bacterium]
MFPILVLRHGETEWNVVGRLQGALDSPLTERGVEQAIRQKAILGDLDLNGWHWRVSPLGRTVRTAEIVLDGPVPDACLDDDLKEIAMGDWTGVVRTEIAKANPELFEADGLAWYDHAPGGEGLRALAARSQALLDGLTAPTVLVTHGITSRVLRCLATARPWEEFDQIGGGQGVVYRVENGVQRMLK